MDADKPENQRVKTVLPGLWIDANDNPHFDTAEFLTFHGEPVTKENCEMVSRMFTEMFRAQFGDVPVKERFISIPPPMS